MFEFLIALLIFSMGMLGVLSAQLAGKKAGYDASQRSVATALARDILERMRANPGQINSYQVSDVGNESRRLSRPGTNCDASICSATQLAAFDLWQWESLLVGESEEFSGGYAGGLLSPRACISSDEGQVAVAISWLGAIMTGHAAENTQAAACGEEEIEPESGGEVISVRQRHQLTISTYIGER